MSQIGKNVMEIIPKAPKNRRNFHGNGCKMSDPGNVNGWKLSGSVNFHGYIYHPFFPGNGTYVRSCQMVGSGSGGKIRYFWENLVMLSNPESPAKIFQNCQILENRASQLRPRGRIQYLPLQIFPWKKEGLPSFQ